MVSYSPTANPVRPLWPPDDTEESVLGTALHQYTITGIRWGINEVAAAEAAPGVPRPWEALSQTMLTGLARPDGTRHTAYPDVFVYPHPVGPRRSSMSLVLDGPPVLIVEVASEATYDSDLDLEAGKGWIYAHAGVREYLVLDPTRVLLPELGRGWRLVDGVYVPWQPDAQGCWQSETIGVALSVEDGLATVYRRDGERQLREGEVSAALHREREARIQAEAEVAELRRRLEAQGRP